MTRSPAYESETEGHQWRRTLDMAMIAILEVEMRSANIADLRNHLTQYLKEVRAGQEIIVRDRQRPIAKIVPLTVDDELAADAALIAAGLIRKGERPLPASFWRVRRGPVSRRAAAAAVSQDRNER